MYPPSEQEILFDAESKVTEIAGLRRVPGNALEFQRSAEQGRE